MVRFRNGAPGGHVLVRPIFTFQSDILVRLLVVAGAVCVSCLLAGFTCGVSGFRACWRGRWRVSRRPGVVVAVSPVRCGFLGG